MAREETRKISLANFRREAGIPSHDGEEHLQIFQHWIGRILIGFFRVGTAEGFHRELSLKTLKGRTEYGVARGNWK